MGGFILAMVVATLSGFWARSIAVSKGYSSAFFWLGFIFPIVGVVVAACLTDNQEYYYKEIVALLRQIEKNQAGKA